MGVFSRCIHAELLLQAFSFGLKFFHSEENLLDFEDAFNIGRNALDFLHQALLYFLRKLHDALNILTFAFTVEAGKNGETQESFDLEIFENSIFEVEPEPLAALLINKLLEHGEYFFH